MIPDKQTRDKMIAEAINNSGLTEYNFAEMVFANWQAWHFAVFPKGMTAAEASPLFKV